MAATDELWRRVTLETGRWLLTVGVVVLLFVAYELVGTNIAEHHAQVRLGRQFTHQLSQAAITPTTKAPTAPKSTKGASSASLSATQHLPAVPAGAALDRLVVPAIGFEGYVVQGVSTADLQMGPGHYPGTPLPGQPGNVAIAGHRTTFGAPFYNLGELSPGGLVYLTSTSGTTWVYRVERQWVVAPTDVGVVAPTSGAMLTLTTCNPKFEATSRLVVRAALVKHYGRGQELPNPLPARSGQGDVGRGTGPHGLHGTLPPIPVTAAGTSTTTPTASPGAGGAPHPGGTSSASQGSRAGGASDNPVVGASPNSATAAGSPPTSVSWPGALGWGAAALAVWAVTRVVAARLRKWPKMAALVAGGLIALVPLWPAFGHVVDLLPDNF